MKAEGQIRQRIVESEEQLAFWRQEGEKARKDGQLDDNGYLAYSTAVTTHFKDTIKILEWVLS